MKTEHIRKVLGGLVLAAGFATSTMGATIYVNNSIGNDGSNGEHPEANGNQGPVRTIQRGLDLLPPSGRLDICRTGIPYPGGNALFRVSGTPENPIVIEGNGATISGLGHIGLEEWKETEPGIYSYPFWPMSNDLRRDPAATTWIGTPQIWWLNKKAAANCLSMDELKRTPGGFFWDKAKQLVYFHKPEGEPSDKIGIELPIAASGLNVYGAANYVVVRDLRSEFSTDDGFDVHGGCKGIVFDSCIATDNCGQGFSMHGTSVVEVRNSFATRNASSGTCDVNDCKVTYSQCAFVDNSYEAGVQASGNSEVRYVDCLIAGNQPSEQVRQRISSKMNFENCVITGKSTKPLVVIQQGEVRLSQCSLAEASTLAVFSGSGQLIVGKCDLNNILKSSQPESVGSRLALNDCSFDAGSLKNWTAPSLARGAQTPSSSTQRQGAKLPESVRRLLDSSTVNPPWTNSNDKGL